MKIFIEVTVIYALSEKQYIKKILLKPGSTIQDAIIISGILKIRKEINIKNNKVGVFNTIKSLLYKLKNKDRVEIYRNLILNPNEFRLRRLKN